MIIYSTPSCPRCKMLGEALRASGVPYEEKPLDVPTMTECACDTGISIREAPLVHVGDRWIFASDLFDRAGLLPGWKVMLCQTT